MPHRRNHQEKPPTSTSVSLSNPSAFTPPSNLTEDLILSILKRLPVKSILRFKCVSKEWLSLLSTPSFISMHRDLTSNNPLNYSLIVHNFDVGKISLLNVNSAETEPIFLNIPSPVVSEKMELVGSINGLVCLNCGPPEPMILLWNPAMNLYKLIRPPVHDDTRAFSLGFAYDDVNDDHKIIRIDSLSKNASSNLELLFKRGGEVYSSNLDSWKRVQMDFPFVPISTGKSFVTAKGIPYWCGLLIQDINEYKFTRVLVYYDMQNDSFKQVPMPNWAPDHLIGILEWKGNLSMMVLSSLSKDKDKDYFIDIWVYDEIGMCWNKISRHGPIGLKRDRSLQCSQDWLIMTNSSERKLKLYDPVTTGIKEFSIPEARVDDLVIFSYTESLVTIKGMEQVKEQDK